MVVIRKYRKFHSSIPDLISRIRQIASLRQGRRNPRPDRLSRSELEQLIIWMDKMVKIAHINQDKEAGQNEE